MKQIIPLSALFCLLASSCDDTVHSDGYKGQPLVVVNGVLSGELPQGVSSDSLRATIGWVGAHYDFDECKRGPYTEEVLQKCRELYEKGLSDYTATDVTAKKEFPASIEFSIHELPTPKLKDTKLDSELYFGYPFIYEDRNNNKKVDMMPLGSTEMSPDRMVANSFIWKRDAETEDRLVDPEDSRYDDDTENDDNYDEEDLDAEIRLIVFRRGSLPNNWNQDSFWVRPGCPEPPQGFSLLHIKEFSEDTLCSVESLDQVNIPLQTDPDLLQVPICEAKVLMSRLPVVPPIAGSSIDCGSFGSFHSIAYPESICFQEDDYALYEEDHTSGEILWDIRDNPPDWWPCDSEGRFIPNPKYKEAPNSDSKDDVL